MEDDAVAEDAGLADVHLRIEVAIAADGHVLGDEDESVDDGAVADGGTVLDDGVGADVDILAEGDALADDGSGVDAGFADNGLGPEDGRERGKSLVGVLHADEGGGALAIVVGMDEDGSGLGVLHLSGVLLVGQEGDITLARLQEAGHGVDFGLAIAAKGAVDGLRDLTQLHGEPPRFGPALPGPARQAVRARRMLRPGWGPRLLQRQRSAVAFLRW